MHTDRLTYDGKPAPKCLVNYIHLYKCLFQHSDRPVSRGRRALAKCLVIHVHPVFNLLGTDTVE